MFSGFMVNAWEVATIVAVIAGVVGFFVVLRGSAFVAHAIPNGAFAGAAAANLVGVSSLLGLAVCAVLAALGIGTLGRKGRHDAVTALALVMMLALGALFLSRSGEYESQVYSLLFGEVLGVSKSELLPIAGLGVVCVASVIFLFRPLLLSSLMPEVIQAKGVNTFLMEIMFLILVALATAMTVPVIGALLVFSLMIGPGAAARSLSDRPHVALMIAVAISLATVWCAIAASYLSNWPIGFFVGVFAAGDYAIGRIWVRSTTRKRKPLSANVGVPIQTTRD